MNKGLLASLFVLVLGACASTPQAVAPAPAPAPVAPAAKPADVAPAPVAQALPPYKDPSNILYKERSVYFDFNKFDVKPEYQAAVAAHAKYLAATPAMKIKLEGNADERGSREYNLALGQKRAEAVKKAMEVSGANASQIETISWGKEKPKAQGHDEAAWAENRRADIVYP
jgi:peptidoglycan-associated lipoprotein